MLHPALLAVAQHGSPDYGHLRMDSNDRNSDCNSGEISYDGIQPTISFANTNSISITNINSKISKNHFRLTESSANVVQRELKRVKKFRRTLRRKQ